MYLETNTTVTGECHQCQCLFNGTLVCEAYNCISTTPNIVSTNPPSCMTSWTQWTQCPPGECNATRTRTRECNTTNVQNCDCESDIITEVDFCNPCESSPTTTPYFTSTTGCPPPKVQDCYNLCNDTCQYHNDPACHLVTLSYDYEDCAIRCKCPPGYKEDDTGDCVRVEECPCYHEGTWYPLGFNVSYPERCEQCSCEPGNNYACSSTPGCCIYTDWSEWSNCDAYCGKGVQIRTKVGVNLECPEDLVEERPCTGRCVCVVEGVEYPNGTTFVSPDDECLVCACVNNATVCEPDPDLVENGTWTTWAEWSLCTGTSNCRDYTRVRCRFCDAPKCGGDDCQGPAVEVEPCSDAPCCEVYKWSEWGDCSTQCGQGVRTRHKIFNDNVTASDCANTQVVDNEECGDCNSCNDFTQWTTWSPCTSPSGATCGYGETSRSRSGPDCPGVKLRDTDICFLGPCDCPEDMEYSNHSDCQPTCLQTSPDPACLLSPSAGCVCANGTFFDGSACVPPEECNQCTFNNVTYQPGEQWECGTCDLCQCCAGHVTVVPRPCPDLSQCDMTTHHLVVTDDECCPIKCEPKRCELKTEPPAQITIEDCISRENVTVQYCEGECPANRHLVDYSQSTLAAKECTCCTATVTSYQTIHLQCPGGVTKDHTIPIIGHCICDVSVCPL